MWTVVFSAEDIVVADDHRARPAAVFEILRDGADEGVGKKNIPFARGGGPFNLGMVMQNASPLPRMTFGPT